MSDPFDDPVFLALAAEASQEQALHALAEQEATDRQAAAEAEYRTAHPGGTCTTCRHAEPYGPQQLICGLVTQAAFCLYPRVETNHRCPDGNEEVDAYLVVPRDFGCNRHVEVCPECGGIGGDCDAGDDGRSISWACGSCGGSGKAADTSWRRDSQS